MKKNRYDTAVILLYLIGQEALLPQAFRRKIPYSTISSWRKTSFSSYLGTEFRGIFESNVESVAALQSLFRVKRLLVKIRLALKNSRPVFTQLYKIARTDESLKGAICSSIDILKATIGLTKTLQLIHLNKDQYYLWLTLNKKTCLRSADALCTKRFPNQLRKEDKERIESLLRSATFQHWPIASIAAHALRKKIVTASTFTWYRIAKQLEIAHPLVKKEKSKYNWHAAQPNEYLHVDTTYYKPSPTKTICITFVSDNYSKMILGFSVAEQLNFEVVKNAIKQALKIIIKHTQIKDSYLVADGGKENHNSRIDQFLSSLTGHRLIKVRALKDIQFSNNPVEAIHKIMKGRYLKNQYFDSVAQLERFLNWAVHDYNYIRPHTRHLPQTPSELYFQKKLNFDPKLRIKESQQKRIKENQKRCCGQCQLPLRIFATANL